MENLDHEQVLDIKFQHNTRSWSSIPNDLLIDILSRNLPKSIARSRCVSKIWNSILRSPDFTQSFLSRSLSRPRLLFTFLEDESLFFYSSPQPRNQGENSSLVALVDHHTSFFAHVTSGICLPVNGFVCPQDLGWKYKSPLICNPSTRQSITLPLLDLDRVDEKRYFGYDPVDKIFKVLSVTWSFTGTHNLYEEHHVLTLDAGELIWRKIECPSHYYLLYSDGICINGVMYYPASIDMSAEVSTIVCFDVRAEKFSFINTAGHGIKVGCYSTLVNYNGKLGILQSKTGVVVGEFRYITLWVLVDPEKHIWSTKKYQFPSMWETVVRFTGASIVGITSTGEFVLSPNSFSSNPFYVFFYDPEKNTMATVEIQGIDQRFKDCKVHTSIDYIENVKLI